MRVSDGPKPSNSFSLCGTWVSPPNKPVRPSRLDGYVDVEWSTDVQTVFVIPSSIPDIKVTHDVCIFPLVSPTGRVGVGVV